jgi:hypothetical protein
LQVREVLTNKEESKMERFAFISRHEATKEQAALAAEKGIKLVPFGDMDAFGPNLLAEVRQQAVHVQGVVVVHPWAAIMLAQAGYKVGVFENANRAPEGEKPSFSAKALHIADGGGWLPPEESGFIRSKEFMLKARLPRKT